MLHGMMDDREGKQNNVYSNFVEKQKKLEETLLSFSQLKDVIQALIDWLKISKKILSEYQLDNDIGTVMILVDQYKFF